MKIKTLLTLSVLLSISFGSVQATLPDLSLIELQVKSLQSEMENSGSEDKCQIRKKIIEDNIGSIQKCLMKKIKKLNAKLTDYRSELEIANDEDEIEYLMYRIKDVEKKLKDLNDVLLGIELLKSRLTL